MLDILECTLDVIGVTYRRLDGRVLKALEYLSTEKTISCLSKLYRCLEPTIFTGLAQEPVEVCATSILIAPCDTEFSVTHKELDFSHMPVSERKSLALVKKLCKYLVCRNL